MSGPMDRAAVQACIDATVARIAEIDPALAARARGARATWSKRMTRAIGKAKPGHPVIKLSSVIWPYLTREEQETTIVHELCHVVLPAGVGHGRPWKVLMLRLEQEPERCAERPEGMPEMGPGRRARVEVECGCGTQTIGAVRAKRLRSGEARYRCGRCREVVRLAS